jgi:tetratricopeptide (TPR) repeat protein
MKKIFIFIILIFININFLYAEDRNSELNRLFEELKIKDKSLSFKIEQKIWKIWSTHPDNNELTSMLSIGSDFVNNNQYLSAVEIFTKVIELDPSWAEAWNKRATVLYMMGEFEKSQNDIDEVLKLEKRHFGALAGQGLVNIKLKNYEKAIMSYEEAIKIYPSMNSPKIMIKEIKELIKNQSI